MPKTTQEALEDLLKQYNSLAAYTPKTDEQIRTQAEGEYQSYYDQLRLAAQQQQERSDLALANQRANLQLNYDLQRQASQREWAARYSQADRQMLSRGMQRSSYAAQVLAGLGMQAAEAQDTIGRQQSAAEGNIDAQRAQLESQLAAQLAQYDASQAADVLNRIRALEDQEYDRGQQQKQNSINLSSQIYNALYQQDRAAVQDAQWERQFAESQRQFDAELDLKYEQLSKSGGGGGGSRKKAAAVETPLTTPQIGGTSDQELQFELFGPGTSSSSGGVGTPAGRTHTPVYTGSVSSTLSGGAGTPAKSSTTSTSSSGWAGTISNLLSSAGKKITSVASKYTKK